MQAIIVPEHGGPEALEVAEIDRPEPDRDEVLVEVETAGVNRVDVLFISGTYPPVELPFTPGVDLAGRVEAVGEEIEGIQPGDRVAATGIGNSSYQGAFAEFAVVPSDRVISLPDSVDTREIGAISHVGATAWRALIDHADIGPLHDVLIHGGSGGVGHVGIQIADAVSASVIATSKPEYHGELEALGADVTLDFDREDLTDAIVEGSTGGVDSILDHMLDYYLQLDADVAATGATVVGIGETRPDPGFSHVPSARTDDVKYQFMSVFNTPDLRVPLRGLAHLMDIDTLTPCIEKRFSLDEAGDAIRMMNDVDYLGKLVVEP